MIRAVLPVLVVVMVPAVAFSAPEFDSDEVDREVVRALQSWSVPGAALVVVREGKVIHLKGYGTKRFGRDEPVTPDTLFPLASCTKAFTTAAIASLVDEGVLDWDDPVRKHLPTFRLSDEAADRLVTIRDLLSHRSGIGSHDLLWYHAAWTPDETIRRIPQLPLSYPFRSGYQYSSLPVMAAGKAAANRFGKDWDQLVRERVCEPLGMKVVAFTTKQAAEFSDRAFGHVRSKDGKTELMPEFEMIEPNPAGSMFTTARDLAPWLILHLTDDEGDIKRVISTKNLGETRQPHNPIRIDAAVRSLHPDTHLMNYAMGWVVYDHRGEQIVAHGGVIDGFRVQFTLLPKHRFGFALLNNLHQTKMNLALGNTLIDRLLGLKPKDWNALFLKAEADEQTAKNAALAVRLRERKADVKPTHPLNKYGGEYDQNAYGMGTVVENAGKLEWRYSTFRIPLEHWQADTFRVTSGLFENDLIEFTVSTDAVTGVRFRGILFLRK